MKFLLIVLLICGVLVAIFTITTQNVVPSQSASVTVDILGLGQVLGDYDITAWTNQTFMRFRGIPYAESPKGNLRFKPPVARYPWRNILYAKNYGRRCPEITTIAKLTRKELKEDLEDCLSLCVYTKSLTAKRPVMFYLYGGGFYNGSTSDHPPNYLLEKDIVLVVANYRTGALGWATTKTSELPGNVPIMDAQLALQWIQDHIADFGGDAKSVTLFGQSAGAAVSGSLIVSPTTKSTLFQKAIIQSGSIYAHWAMNKKPEEQAQRICKALKCSACDNDEGIYHCLRTADVVRMLEVTTDESFSPILGDFHGVLPQDPAVLMQNFNRPLPLMTGFTKHDGSFVLATIYDAMKKAYGNLDNVTVRDFAKGLESAINDTTGLSNNLLTKLLFPSVVLNGNDHKKALPAYFDLSNIIYIKSPMITLASELFRKHLAPIYLYSFDYEGEHTRFGYEFGNEHYPFNGGVHHSNDNIYVFNTHSLNAEDTKFSQKMIELWTSFATDGVPKISEGPTLLPMETESGPYFHIDKEFSIGVDVLQELTATIDDPLNKNLDREDIPF